MPVYLEEEAAAAAAKVAMMYLQASLMAGFPFMIRSGECEESWVCPSNCLSIKLNFIGDKNPLRDSSAGVQLFPFSTLDPHSGYTVAHVFGFVEELVVADDPEFEWSDNFNQANRTSHETRQTLMYLLDAKVRRRMCKKVLEMGGNAVLGYHQNFDFEGDSGLVARTFGTCVLIQRKEMVKLINNPNHRATQTNPSERRHEHSLRKEMVHNTSMMLSMMSEATAAAACQREGCRKK